MHGLPILRSTPQLRSRIRSWRAFGETVALAPVGASLHEGHLALIRAARDHADRVLAVVGNWGEDEGCRSSQERGEPFDEDAAAELAEEAGADALYIPSAESLFPADVKVEIKVAGMTDVLCGEDRPERFEGFALAAVRLLGQAQADVALMGECDWQRLAILRKVSADLGLPTEIRTAATERDQDGLAFGPADALEGEERETATRLWRELQKAARAIDAGGDADAVLDDAADALAEAGAEVEYLEMREAETLAEIDGAPADLPAGRQARIFAAIQVGGARLVDNVVVGEKPDPLG